MRGCRPSVLPGGHPGSRPAAARAWKGRRAARCLRAARTLGPTELAPPCPELPICLRAGARPSQPGRQDVPAVWASLCYSFTHVCNLDSHCLGTVGLGDNDTRFVFVSGSARANAFSFFSGTLVSFSGIAPMAFM